MALFAGNELERALRKIGREDVIHKCMYNIEEVTDEVEKAVAKTHLDQSGFDELKEELGTSRDSSMQRGMSLDVSYDEEDIIKVNLTDLIGDFHHSFACRKKTETRLVAIIYKELFLL